MSFSLATLIHLVLLVGLLKVTAILLVVAVVNRMRVKDTVVNWQTGRLWGVALWPMLYLGTVFVTAVASLLGYTSLHIGFSAGYAVAGVFWLLAAQIYVSTLITERGIIRNVNRATQTLAWGQIVDYCEQRTLDHITYIFFFLDPHGARQRFELHVPKHKLHAFKQLVERKVDARFTFEIEQHYAKRVSG